MGRLGFGIATNFDSEVCNGDNHVYPKIYAGSPEYAEAYFSVCKCGKKRKVTTVKEIDNTKSKSNKRSYR